MKKFLTVILAVSLLIGSVLVFSSCDMMTSLFNSPELDLEDAKDNLEDNGYSVSYNDDPSQVNVKETLTATYSDSFFSGAKETLNITVYADSKSASLAYDKLKIQKDVQKEFIELQIQEYENILKKYDDDLRSSESDYYEDQIKDLEEQLEELEDAIIGKSGNTVWYGTKQAIDDSKH